MKYCNLGNLKSSAIVMGCMRIAPKPLALVEKTIIEGVQTGVNTFDLADIYGGGDCEKVFGVAMRDIKLARENYLVQTKCGIERGNGSIKRYNFSKEYILNSVDGSLKRLNMEYIDILLLHRPDTLMDAEEVAETFQILRENGKVKQFGVSNFSAAQIKILQQAGSEVVANQIQFSLGHTLPVDAGFNVNTNLPVATTRAGDVMEYCQAEGIALQAWSPMQYGFFAGTFIGNRKFKKLNELLNQLAEKYNAEPSAIACAWILRHPAFKQVVTGTTDPQHMAAMCKAGEIELTGDEWYALYLATGKTLP